MMDYCISELGQLAPPCFAASGHVHPVSKASRGVVEINGVELPLHVADELRRLGVCLAWYNSNELKDAVQACAYDRKLIDNPTATRFSDRLKKPAQTELWPEPDSLALFQ